MNHLARLSLGSALLVCSLLNGPVSQAASAQATCPIGVNTAAGTKPALLIIGNPTLMVCGSTQAPETSEASEKWKGKILFAGFEVYSLKPKAKPEVLMQDSELERALVSKKGQELVVESMIYFRKDWVPAFQFNYTRKDKAWKKSDEKLILKLPQKLNADEVRESEELLAKAKAQKPMDEIDVAKVFEAALMGDAKAKEFFENPKTKAALDGASAEEYFRDQKILKRIKAASAKT